MAVFHLNSRDIFHRDLKPANFLIKRESNGKIYLHLTDFGIAKNMQDLERMQSNKSNKKGTNEYLAPENHMENPHITKQDVWAIGVIIY